MIVERLGSPPRFARGRYAPGLAIARPRLSAGLPLRGTLSQRYCAG